MVTTLHGRRLHMLPEVSAGGFSRHDGTVEFYLRVNALVDTRSVVLDYGAGRGKYTEDAVKFRRNLQQLHGKAKRVIGVDVDAAVTENPNLDEAHVVAPSDRLPIGNATVDMIVSDFTFEHIKDPSWTAAELTRVLRPGGWICARTPNKWGTIAVPARLVPNRLHDLVLRRVQPQKEARDTFPTFYRLNDAAALHKYFPTRAFRHCSYTHDSEPAYVGRSATAWSLFFALAAVTPSPFRSMLLVFIQKR